jgi:hypothetical protein
MQGGQRFSEFLSATSGTNPRAHEGELPSLAAVPTGAIIPFGVGGNNSRNFRAMPTSLPTWKPQSLLLFPIPLEGGETSIGKRGGADC